MKYKIIGLIIVVVLLSYGSINEYLTLIENNKQQVSQFIQKQVKFCGQTIEDDFLNFESTLKFTFSNIDIESLLIEESMLTDDVLYDKNQDIITQIRRFYSKNQDLISSITFYNNKYQQIFQKNKDNFIKISKMESPQLPQKLSNNSELIFLDSRYFFIHPIRNNFGKVIANVKIELNIANFILSSFQNFYIGKDSWYWLIDTLGKPLAVRYSETDIIFNHFKVISYDSILIKIKTQKDGLTENKLSYKDNFNVISGFYPVNISDFNFGIVFSINSDIYLHDQNDKTLNILIAGIFIVISIIIIFSMLIWQRMKDSKVLFKKEEQFRGIIESINEVFWEIDINGNFNYISPQLEKVLGFSVEKFINQSSSILIPTDFLDFIKDIFEIGENKNKTLSSFESTFTKKNGELCYLEHGGSPIYDKNGLINGFRGLTRDVTEHKEFEQKLIESKEIADSANRAKSEFLANMSHEIRTPMNAILGFTEILYNSIETTTEKSYLKTIFNSGKVLLALINDILDLSKIESGKLLLEYNPVDLKNLMNDLIQIFSQKVSEAGLTISYEIDEKFPQGIVIDEIRLRQVLINMIGNAIKFTSAGFIKIKIEIESLIDDKKINFAISIIDSGIGIPGNQQNIIFETFRQQDGQSTRKYGGTGLGLAISKKIVEMMGGYIELNSTVNVGSTFTIHLVNIVTIEKFTQENSKTEINLNQISFFGSKVLLVDDIVENRQLIKSYLQSKNLIILEAENGIEAIEQSIKYMPDLVFMDLRMPKMNGYDATKEIKKNPATKHIPIIALTASFMKDDEIIIRTLFDEFLTKPVNSSDLARKLIHFLNHEINNETAISKENVDESIEITLEYEDKTKLSEIIAILENDFKIKCDKILEIMYVDDVNIFIAELKDLGINYSSNLIANYANKLEMEIQSFDLEELEKTLKHFDSIVAKLKSFI